MKRLPLGAWLIAAMLFSPVGAQAGTLTVNSGGDAGGPCPGVACTLRQAILDATPGDTIDFAPGLTTIDLTSAELLIDKSLIVTGPGASSLTIQRPDFGAGSFRILHIVSGSFNVTISGVTIKRGNAISATLGGGILNQGTLTVTGCTISGNSASQKGSGVYNDAGATVIITNSAISSNAGTGNGGAIYNLGTATITDSTISDNDSVLQGPGGTGNLGGGIYNSGTVTITNSTISGNDAQTNGSTARGGGMYNHDTGTMNVINVTISNNVASEGGGIYNNSSGTVNVRNTIIATNMAGVAAGSHDFHGALTSEGFNLIGNNTAAIIIGAQITDQIGTAGSPIDPRLDVLQDNGGATKTHALLSDSTAIDQGHSSDSNTDQRGFIRPVDDPFIPNVTSGDGGDIGAFEVQAPVPTPTPTPTPPPPPTPTPTATPPPTPTPTATPPPTVTPTPSPPPAAQALNLSTRMFVQTGDNVGIGGFIIQGSVPKRVMLRGVGPSTLPGALADPVLELHGPPGFATVINDNCDPGFIPSPFCMPGSLDAAIEANLAPGAYTAIVRGKNDTTGIALVEVYDLNQGVDSKLANISTRAFVGTADNIVIAGFILGGSTGNGRILARGIGPSLANYGIANPLADPRLELRDNNGALLLVNDNWQENPIMPVLPPGMQPTNPLESVIMATLPPGLYTALLSGVNNGTGVGLVEVYDIAPSATPPPTATPTPSPTPSPGITPSPTPSATPTPSPAAACTENFDGTPTVFVPNAAWVISTVNPFSPPNCLSAPVPDKAIEASVVSANISIHSTAAVLSFRNNFDTGHEPFLDGYVLEVSTDGGATWPDVIDAGGAFVSGPYTGEIKGIFNNPLAGRMAWTGDSGGYIHTVINLPASLAHQTIKLRFRLGTDEAAAAPGVRIDDFVLTGGSCP